MSNPFRYFKTLPELIRLTGMIYIRFLLSLRKVEDLLDERAMARFRQCEVYRRSPPSTSKFKITPTTTKSWSSASASIKLRNVGLAECCQLIAV